MKGEKTSLLECTPIGYIRNARRTKFDAPHQPDYNAQDQAIVELNPRSNFESALKDLEGFSHIWLLWWFHRNKTWRPLVLPPRGASHRRGVFATRSPHRPNPIGLTAVPLLAVEKRKIIIGSNDLLDGTPILDIKPYLRGVDSFPQASQGWLDQVEAELRAPCPYSVQFSQRAEKELGWLEQNFHVPIRQRSVEILSRDPTPHRTRRIARSKDGKLKIGCGAWKLAFTIENSTVHIDAIEPGYPMKLLLKDGYEDVPDREAQLAFIEWTKARI